MRCQKRKRSKTVEIFFESVEIGGFDQNAFFKNGETRQVEEIFACHRKKLRPPGEVYCIR